MKNIINIALASLLLFSFSACDRDPVEQGHGVGNHKIKQLVTLYVDGDANSKAQMYKPQEINIQDVDAKEIEKVLSVGLNFTEDKDKTLNFEVSDEYASIYMDRTHKKYEIYPSSLIELPKDAIVAKGSLKSVSIPFKVKVDNSIKFNVPYIFAIRLLGVGNEVVQSNSVAIYTLTRTIGEVKIDKAVHLYRTNYFDLEKTFPEDLPNGMTIECLINPQQFRSPKDPGEAQISTLCGIEGHCLFRFGDAGVPGNYLQCYGAKLNQPFELNKWYHFAATISPEGDMKVYINGKELMSISDKEASLSGGDGWFIGRSYSNGRGINALFSEFRVWDTVRTPEQIQESMLGVDPAAKGLLAYWKMDKAEGDKVTDATNHGYNLILKKQTDNADSPDQKARPADKNVVVDDLKSPVSID